MLWHVKIVKQLSFHNGDILQNGKQNMIIALFRLENRNFIFLSNLNNFVFNAYNHGIHFTLMVLCLLSLGID